MRVRIRRRSADQRGAAFLLLVITLVLGAAAVFYGLSRAPGTDAEKGKKTAAVLAQAKAALIGYAVAAPVNNGSIQLNRPGDLPCPDSDDDGDTELSCGDAPGITGQAKRIGRLPWKTLGLPDLRDGDGERLWYAVSKNFKYNERTSCTAAGSAGCLNSDTRGTITIRDSAGNIIYDATNTDPAASGAVAVIFSPGAVLRRQDGTLQDRTCAGGAGCTPAGVCNATTTPKCNPVNYLDISGAEDNADFVDSVPSTNGFINGLIRDASGIFIVNDRLMVISYQDVMPRLEKRVAAEVLKCLAGYAAANNGRYPWAAPATDVTLKHDDVTNTLFGRLADQPLSQTQLGLVSTSSPVVGTLLQTACAGAPSSCMSAQWPGACPLPTAPPPSNSWWDNWKLHVFYGVADAYKPLIAYTQPTPATVSLGGIPAPTGCPSCLTVNPPSAAADKQVVVMVSGRRLPAVAAGQPRTSTANWQNTANYLEGGNAMHPTFTRQSATTTFNDTVVYK